jgi:hypothetical protein
MAPSSPSIRRRSVSLRHRRIRLLFVAACAALAAGCASQAKRDQADVDAIAEMLPGRYDNQAQVAEDQRAGRTPHEALTLSVTPVDAAELGLRIFYLQETATGTREIKLQRLLSMGFVDGKIVTTLWSFTDPARWREGDTTPELFTSLQPPDVRVMRGCNLVWKKETARFTASNERGKCEPSVSRTGVLQSLEVRVVLTADELALSTRPVDSQGNPSNGRYEDPYTRFRRSGGS